MKETLSRREFFRATPALVAGLLFAEKEKPEFNAEEYVKHIYLSALYNELVTGINKSDNTLLWMINSMRTDDLGLVPFDASGNRNYPPPQDENTTT